jgi:hypothetical protein
MKDPNAPVAPLTDPEILSLHSAATERQWNSAVAAILAVRDGNYPPQWMAIAGPIMRKFG